MKRMEKVEKKNGEERKKAESILKYHMTTLFALKINLSTFHMAHAICIQYSCKLHVQLYIGIYQSVYWQSIEACVCNT